VHIAAREISPQGKVVEDMAHTQTVQAKSLDSPDETRSLDKGKMQIAHLDEVTAGRVTLESGWKWSECVKPLAGTDSCQVQHTGYMVSGRMHVAMDDGSEQEIEAGDMYVIRPGMMLRSSETRLLLG
jgi:uncharacterized cupin superfamily protein